MKTQIRKLLNHLHRSFIRLFLFDGKFQHFSWGQFRVNEPIGGPTVRGLLWPNRGAANWNDREAVVRALIDKRGPVIFDVGANIGMYSLIFSKFDGASVYAFEPGSEAFKALAENVRQNNLTNVSVRNLGLSDVSETHFIGQPYLERGDRYADDKENSCHWSVYAPQSDYGCKAEFRPLDAIAAELNLDRLDFIKIDVEGHEIAVLRGAKNTIQKTKPAILLEYHPLPWGLSPFTPADLVRWADESNYTLYELRAGSLHPLGQPDWKVPIEIVAQASRP